MHQQLYVYNLFMYKIMYKILNKILVKKVKK